MANQRKADVLIADAEPMSRMGAIQLIDAHPRLRVCGEAETQARAKELSRRLQPRVLVLDWSAGEICTFIKDLPRWSPQTRVVVVTRWRDSLSVQRAFQAGARGYLARQDPPTAMIEAVLAALEDRRYIGPQTEGVLLENLACGGIEIRNEEEVIVSSLSDRELQVFRLVGQGEGTRLVAKRLGLSVKTVETHLERIKRKLQLRNGQDLVRRASLFSR